MTRGHSPAPRVLGRKGSFLWVCILVIVLMTPRSLLGTYLEGLSVPTERPHHAGPPGRGQGLSPSSSQGLNLSQEILAHRAAHRPHQTGGPPRTVLLTRSFPRQAAASSPTLALPPEKIHVSCSLPLTLRKDTVQWHLLCSHFCAATACIQLGISCHLERQFPPPPPWRSLFPAATPRRLSVPMDLLFQVLHTSRITRPVSL